MTMERDIEVGPAVAVVYLARGMGNGHLQDFARFINSYKSIDSGIDHALYVIFKGFTNASDRKSAENIFCDVKFTAVETDDLRFDIGAYSDSLSSVSEEFVCFLNTYSEINSQFWLRKLIDNLRSPGAGLVGATGSYESLKSINRAFPGFPNPHLRTNAFAMRTVHARSILESYEIRSKLDTFFIESGYDSITRKILDLGLTCLIVGADGRGFNLPQWPQSGTYRLGSQENLLISDNYTREYLTLNSAERLKLAAGSWGANISSAVIEMDLPC